MMQIRLKNNHTEVREVKPFNNVIYGWIAYDHDLGEQRVYLKEMWEAVPVTRWEPIVRWVIDRQRSLAIGGEFVISVPVGYRIVGVIGAPGTFLIERMVNS